MNPTGILETAKATNPLIGLQKFGQSIWLDYIRRDLLTGGELKRLIDEDGLRGMTSEPCHLRKSHRRQHPLRRCSEISAAAHRPHPDRPLRNSRHPRYSGCGRHSPPGVRQHQAARWIRESGSYSLSRATTPKAHSNEARRLWKAVARRTS